MGFGGDGNHTRVAVLSLRENYGWAPTFTLFLKVYIRGLDRRRTQMALSQTFWSGRSTRIGYHHPKCCPRSLDMAQKRGNATALHHSCGLYGWYSTKYHLWPNQDPWCWAVRHHCSERLHSVEVEKRQTGLWAGEKSWSGEVRVVRKELKWMTSWPLESREMSGLGLWPGARFWSRALEQPREPMLISVAPVPTWQMKRPVVLVAKWGSICVWGQHCCGGHANMGGLHSHGDNLFWAAAKDLIWVHGHYSP